VTLRYTGRPVFVAEIATAMQRDLTGSVAGTALVIALLFWLTHRRWLPMLWLLALLAAILVATIGLGGLLLGTISVLSLGFAAVLLGLAVDYAVVHYQEARSHPDLSVPEIRRAIAPSILWAAITTIAAFLVLNLSGLPGLAQLGTLVAIGVALAALVMVMVYLPPLFRERRKPPAGYTRPPWRSFFLPPRETTPAPPPGAEPRSSRPGLAVTALLVIVAGGVVMARSPRLDRTANALRPPSAGADAALEEVTAALGLPKDPLWVVVAGTNETAVSERLFRAESRLQQAQTNRLISGFLLPTALWPHPAWQATNRATARGLAARRPPLRAAATGAGFATNALFLTDGVVRAWAGMGEGAGVVWPTNDVGRWMLKRFVAHSTNAWFAMGLVQPPTNRTALLALAPLSTSLAADGVLLSGWELLGATTLKRVQERMWLVLLPMILLVLLSLGLAFRRAVEVLLGLAVLALSGLCLLAVMALAGWSWNLLNLMALPLMLGTGVDYGIFMQLALRRHGGDVGAVRRSIGRALLLCGGTAVVGFGSLAWSSNAGMASLGRVCAVGIGANMLIAVFLLPSWWRHCHARKPAGDRVADRLARPSATYGPGTLAAGAVRHPQGAAPRRPLVRPGGRVGLPAVPPGALPRDRGKSAAGIGRQPRSGAGRRPPTAGQFRDENHRTAAARKRRGRRHRPVPLERLRNFRRRARPAAGCAVVDAASGQLGNRRLSAGAKGRPAAGADAGRAGPGLHGTAPAGTGALGHRNAGDRAGHVRVRRGDQAPAGRRDRGVAGGPAAAELRRHRGVVWPAVRGFDRAGGTRPRRGLRAGAGLRCGGRRRLRRARAAGNCL
jgi:predicted exporter